MPPPFLRLGPADPLSPVVVAVPHAGRDYPSDLLAAARLPHDVLALLEDAHVDALVGDAAAAGTTVFVATRARAWIDLNRSPGELDATMIVAPPPGLVASSRTRGGLGLIPRRIAGHGEVYARSLSAAEAAARIADAHTPWHDAIAAALAAARARFGVAVLLDLHSMPPLPGPYPARLVVGDRHRAGADARFVSALLRIASAGGLRPALNQPYAGGYTLDRHGDRARGVHAVQIELCRSLYLDAARRSPGPGLAATRALVGRLVAALDGEAGYALAAE